MTHPRNDKFLIVEDKICLKKIKVSDQIIFDLIPDACFLFFLITRKVVINQKLIRLFRFNSKQDLLAKIKNGYQFFKSSEKSRMKNYLNKHVNSEAIQPHIYQFIRKDNTLFKGKVAFKMLVLPHSKRPFAYYGTINDIANEKLILKGVKKTFYNLLNDTCDTVIINDFKGKILKANKDFFKINFFAERSIKNYNLLQMIDPEFQDHYRERLAQLRMGNSTGPIEYRLIDEAGRQMYVEMNCQLIKYQNKKAIITQIRNISPQKEMEKKHFETILQTEEKEKQAFARDLHDELGPFLSGIKLYIDEIELANNDNNHRKILIEYLRIMVDEAIMKTRIISNNMVSDILMDFGLSMALTSFVEKINKIHKIRIKLDINNLPDELNKTIEITIYRILIELINNSLKHANSKKINITLRQENAFLKGTYKDDGKGFDINKELKSPSGMGLNSIINRLNSNHAIYSFSSKINEGMQCEIKLPLS